MLEDLQPIHLFGIIIIPQIIMFLTNVVKSVVWKYSSHLNKGDVIFLNNEEATIMSVNFSGLYVKYAETGRQRRINVSLLDKLDVRK